MMTEYNYKQDRYRANLSNDINYQVKLNINGIKKYPYMDSFKYMNRLNGNLITHLLQKIFIRYQTMEYTDGKVLKKTKIFGMNSRLFT
jgi:hypothetical protein